MQQAFAPVAADANPASSLMSNLRKTVKFFGVPFVLAAAADPAAHRDEVFESPRTEHLPVSTRAHIWAPVSALRGTAQARQRFLAAPAEAQAPLPAPRP